MLGIGKSYVRLFRVYSIYYNSRNISGRLPTVLRNVNYRSFRSPHILLEGSHFALLPMVRLKHTKKNKNYNNKYEYESDDSDDDDDDYDDDDDINLRRKGVETKTFSVSSLRVDSLIKLIFNYKRKTVEDLFYKKKIYINGKLLIKKAISVKVGYEIDIIRDVSKENEDLLNVARIEILKIKYREDEGDENNTEITIRRIKSMLVENYGEKELFKAG